MSARRPSKPPCWAAAVAAASAAPTSCMRWNAPTPRAGGVGRGRHAEGRPACSGNHGCPAESLCRPAGPTTSKHQRLLSCCCAAAAPPKLHALPMALQRGGCGAASGLCADLWLYMMWRAAAEQAQTQPQESPPSRRSARRSSCKQTGCLCKQGVVSQGGYTQCRGRRGYKWGNRTEYQGWQGYCGGQVQSQRDGGTRTWEVCVGQQLGLLE